LDQYGKLDVDMLGIQGQIILFLQDKNETIYRQSILNEDLTVSFEYVIPKEYVLKVIHDRNGNGRWDPGNYLKNILPEKVAYFGTVINVRENWEHTEEWDISQEE
jgi:hypothetical protein